MKHSTGMLENINKSQSLGNGILRLADVGRTLKQSVQDGRDHVGFLTRELAYSSDLLGVLKGLKEIKDHIDTAEQLAREREILKSLTVLGGKCRSSKTWLVNLLLTRNRGMESHQRGTPNRNGSCR